MKLPGFTAETSLYKTSKNYTMDSTTSAFTGDKQLLPQGFACSYQVAFNRSTLAELGKLGRLEKLWE